MVEESDAVRLARIEEQVKTLYRQNEAMAKQQETLTEEVRELVAVMNRGRGAFGFAMVMAGAMGAAAMKFIAAFGGIK